MKLSVWRCNSHCNRWTWLSLMNLVCENDSFSPVPPPLVRLTAVMAHRLLTLLLVPVLLSLASINGMYYYTFIVYYLTWFLWPSSWRSLAQLYSNSIRLIVQFQSAIINFLITDVTEKYHVESAEEIRGRLATYTHEKFSHGYHLWTSDDVQRLNHTVCSSYSSPFSLYSYFLSFQTTSSKPPAKRVKSVTSSRVKRDGGLVSGPIATAVVTGMIGMYYSISS